VTDPLARHMDQLSPSEARALFDRFVADGPARLEAFTAAVGDRHGPSDALDRSLDSLERLWPWFLSEAARQGTGAAEGPWWAPFHPPWITALGLSGAQLATGLSEYVFVTIIAHAPGARWVLSRRASTRRHPVLAIPDRGEMDYAVPIGFVVRARAGDVPGDREPRALRRLAEIWLGLDEAYEAMAASLARPHGPWAVQAIDSRRFTHQLSFAESIAHRRANRIARLLTSLAGEPGIVEVLHEDREIALVRAPDRTTDEVSAIVERLWADPDRPHGDVVSGVP
jgi:hypothetical protein